MAKHMSARSGLGYELEKLEKIAPAGYFFGVHIRLMSSRMVFATFPQDWINHYTANAYAMRDLVVAWGFSTTGVAR